MKASRLLIAAALAAGVAALAGCSNAVTSTKPLFSARDARGQAQLRPGVWSYSSSTRLPTCKVDTSQPVETWDRCAGGFVIRPGEIFGAGGPGKPLELYYRFVLARGAPPVFQVLAIGDKYFEGTYYYAGVRPLKFDAQGRVIELKGWQAMCAPLARDDDSAATHTNRMVRGLAPDASHNNCIATSAAPVRVSAKVSDSWATQGGGRASEGYIQWVRDGER